MTKEQFLEWANSPLTKKALKGLRDQKDSLASQWAEGVELLPKWQWTAHLLGRLSDTKDQDSLYEAWFASED